MTHAASSRAIDDGTSRYTYECPIDPLILSTVCPNLTVTHVSNMVRYALYVKAAGGMLDGWMAKHAFGLHLDA